MEHKADLAIIWIFQIFAWWFNLSFDDVVNLISILKDFFAFLSFMLAAGYTAYRWYITYKNRKSHKTTKKE